MSQVQVDGGKYTFVKFRDDWRVRVLRYGEEWLTIESGSNAVSALMAEVERYEDCLGLSTPYPVQVVLAALADAADTLLGDYNYDREGHEGIRHAVTAARLMVTALGER